MKVVILCGGMGTRLREETEYKPKPMVEIGGQPILWHIMKLYSFYGFRDFILCLGYKGHVIRDYFLHYNYMRTDLTIQLGSGEVTLHGQHDEEDWAVTVVDTGWDTPKGGRVKLIEPYVEGQTFMLTYGDGVSNVDLHKLVAFHKARGKIVTFTGVRPRSRYATVDLNSDGSIRGWKEKKQIDSRVNGGYFVMDPRIFAYLTHEQELEEEPMETLAAEGQVMMYHHNGFWECMDTYRDYTYLNDLWDRGETPWAVWRQHRCTEREIHG